jgi:hypothetical protein
MMGVNSNKGIIQRRLAFKGTQIMQRLEKELYPVKLSLLFLVLLKAPVISAPFPKSFFICFTLH